jgi:hypothetical protein
MTTTRSHVLVPNAGTIKLATSQYTDGANVKDDEVSVLGEQHLAAYAAVPGAAANTTTINKHMAQLMAGASLHVYVRWIGIYLLAVAAAATIVEVRLHRLTTAGTGGTAGTQAALDTTDAAAGATSMTMPAVLGTEGAAINSTTMGVIAAAPAAALAEGLLIWSWGNKGDFTRTKAIRIPAGTANGLAVKNATALATATYLVHYVYSEAPY